MSKQLQEPQSIFVQLSDIIKRWIKEQDETPLLPYIQPRDQSIPALTDLPRLLYINHNRKRKHTEHKGNPTVHKLLSNFWEQAPKLIEDLQDCNFLYEDDDRHIQTLIQRLVDMYHQNTQN